MFQMHANAVSDRNFKVKLPDIVDIAIVTNYDITMFQRSKTSH